MKNVLEDPFETTKEIVAAKADIKFVDLHGEATAEKVSYLHYFKNDLTCNYWNTHSCSNS